MRLLREHDYLKRIKDSVPYAVPETPENMDLLAAEMEK